MSNSLTFYMHRSIERLVPIGFTEDVCAFTDMTNLKANVDHVDLDSYFVGTIHYIVFFVVFQQ